MYKNIAASNSIKDATRINGSKRVQPIRGLYLPREKKLERS